MKPTANLDSRQSDNLMSLIQELRQEYQNHYRYCDTPRGIKAERRAYHFT